MGLSHLYMVPCSLLCRTFDAGLAECCHMERVGLLAYSPLAMGLLTVSCCHLHLPHHANGCHALWRCALQWQRGT